MNLEDIKKCIADVPDFPKKGIVFKDATPLFLNREAFEEACRLMAEPFKNAGITKIMPIEARGFLFAGHIARELNAGIVLVRKKGKLPRETVAMEYELEYGTDIIEMHKDALNNTDKVLIVDDILATGGTAEAVVKMARKAGAKVEGAVFLMQLDFLNGDKKLDTKTFSLIHV